MQLPRRNETRRAERRTHLPVVAGCHPARHAHLNRGVVNAASLETRATTIYHCQEP